MRDTILIVDDIEVNRDILSDILSNDYKIECAGNGLEAMETIRCKRDSLAAVLLDLVMPKMDGYEVLEEMREEGFMSSIPVLVITTQDSQYSERECFTAGVSDFIHKPFDNELVKTRVNNVISLYIYKNHLEDVITEQTKIIRRRNSNMLELFANVVETRHLESGEHVRRVKGYTKILAQEMASKYPKHNLTDHLVDVIAEASVLHDIGKISISDSILLKPGKLTADEYEEMKLHTVRGCELFNNIAGMWDEEYGRICYEICRYHHERYDGRGYPDGLMGESIPISAQIVAVADVYDALVHERCYKEAFAKSEAFSMIMNGECGKFSPEVIDCFRTRIEDIEAV